MSCFWGIKVREGALCRHAPVLECSGGAFVFTLHAVCTQNQSITISLSCFQRREFDCIEYIQPYIAGQAQVFESHFLVPSWSHEPGFPGYRIAPCGPLLFRARRTVRKCMLAKIQNPQFPKVSCGKHVQGYLAHKKKRSLRTLKQDYA